VDTHQASGRMRGARGKRETRFRPWASAKRGGKGGTMPLPGEAAANPPTKRKTKEKTTLQRRGHRGECYLLLSVTRGGRERRTYDIYKIDFNRGEDWGRGGEKGQWIRERHRGRFPIKSRARVWLANVLDLYFWGPATTRKQRGETH